MGAGAYRDEVGSAGRIVMIGGMTPWGSMGRIEIPSLVIFGAVKLLRTSESPGQPFWPR